jgi:hypothetical protein
MISTQHYMIVAAGHVQSRWARHPCITQKSDQRSMIVATNYRQRITGRFASFASPAL